MLVQIKTICFIFLFTISAHISFAGYFDDFEDQEPSYTEAQKTWISDQKTYCYESDEYSKYDTVDLCQEYSVAKKEAYNECMASRINGDETKAGIGAIRRVCHNEGDKAGKKAASWFIRKAKVKSIFK